MKHRLAINGYGRIGRSVLRSLYESPLKQSMEVVLINEPAAIDSIVYLTRFDSTHGRFLGQVAKQNNTLCIDQRCISVSHQSQPEAVDWHSAKIDCLIECSGQYSKRTQLDRFIHAGVPRLLLSQPGHSAADVDATIVYGLNHHHLQGTERIVSNASCTTNAVVPVLDLLHQAFGIEHLVLTTLHSVMNDQPLTDGYHHADLRRTRSAMQSMIPVETGLARGIERLLPHLAGRVEAKAIRVPTLNVSAIDLTLVLQKNVDCAAINQYLAKEAQGSWANIIAYSEDPHASIDFNHDPHSAIIDASQTRVSGQRLVNLLIWFDNEWGFANRMLDVCAHWLAQTPPTHFTSTPLQEH